MRPVVTAVGNVTRDPELRFSQNGVAFLTFGIAINVRRKAQDGSWEDADPEFHDVVAWRELAENAAESLAKGQRVIVTGELRQRSWTDQDGAKRTKTELVAEDIGVSTRFATVQSTRTRREPAERRPTAALPEFDTSPF